MSKKITKQENNLRFRTSRTGNLTAVFNIGAKTFYASTRFQTLPREYNDAIYVATSEENPEELVVSDYVTQNKTTQKMCVFEGFEPITAVELGKQMVEHAAKVGYTGSLGGGLI